MGARSPASVVPRSAQGSVPRAGRAGAADPCPQSRGPGSEGAGVPGPLGQLGRSGARDRAAAALQAWTKGLPTQGLTLVPFPYSGGRRGWGGAVGHSSGAPRPQPELSTAPAPGPRPEGLLPPLAQLHPRPPGPRRPRDTQTGEELTRTGEVFVWRPSFQSPRKQRSGKTSRWFATAGAYAVRTNDHTPNRPGS